MESNVTKRTTSPTVARDPARARRVALAGLTGSTIEWYDFLAYGTAAALVFAPQFFPSKSPVAGTLAAFATFAVGFVVRPMGGAVMGHLGDRLGRKRVLVASLVLMGAATFAIGLLPTYASIGVGAPVLLVLLRVIQGFAVGGEWGGAVLMAVEHAPSGRRAFYGSFPQMGLPTGTVLCNVVFLVVRLALDDHQFITWGWRIPFLLSVILVVFGVVLRVRLEESPEFRAVREQKQLSRIPIAEVVKAMPGALVGVAGLTLVSSAVGNVALVYSVTYAQTALHISASNMLLATTVLALVFAVVIPLGALSAERFGRRSILLVGTSACAIWVFPYFWLLSTRSLPLILLDVVVVAVTLGLVNASYPAFVADAFPARLRYSGASVGYAVGGVLGGGLAPLVASALYAGTGSSAPVSAYLVGVGLISITCVALLRSPHTARSQ
ncbi:MFS transporter [Amycolatopsis sacchari]|uniref:MFS transporter n=1 Tax=Amycolatopsis sacchari TaxID=115433 RepID=UPI003EBE7EA4